MKWNSRMTTHSSSSSLSSSCRGLNNNLITSIWEIFLEWLCIFFHYRQIIIVFRFDWGFVRNRRSSSSINIKTNNTINIYRKYWWILTINKITVSCEYLFMNENYQMIEDIIHILQFLIHTVYVLAIEKCISTSHWTIV